MWNPKLYIENSLGDPKEQIRYQVLYNDKGEAYVSEKRVIKGTFMENLELDDFPFDVQVRISAIILELVLKYIGDNAYSDQDLSPRIQAVYGL